MIMRVVASYSGYEVEIASVEADWMNDSDVLWTGKVLAAGWLLGEHSPLKRGEPFSIALFRGEELVATLHKPQG